MTRMHRKGLDVSIRASMHIKEQKKQLNCMGRYGKILGRGRTMRTNRHNLQSVALILAVLMVVYTIPVSAADVTSRVTSIGQVSASGAVDLRGVRISGDGTLFSGDRMNVGAGAYAKVALGAGPKIEVGAGSDVTVTREADNVQVQMASGNVAFKGAIKDGKASIHLRVGAYEVTVPGNASGNVAYIGKDAFGVRVLTGSVSVRNTLTKQSFSVQKGSERLVSLQIGAVTQPLAQLASTVPSAVPVPALPRAQTTGLTKGGWIAVLGTIAGAAAAIVVLTSRDDDSDDDAATRLAQVQAIQNLNTIASTATATTTLAATVNTTANEALTAINASSVSNKTTLQTQANAIIAKANAATTKAATLQLAVTALSNTIANQSGGPTTAQQAELEKLKTDLTSALTDANVSLSDLNDLITNANAAGVAGTPAKPTSQPVSDPTFASASIPV